MPSVLPTSCHVGIGQTSWFKQKMLNNVLDEIAFDLLTGLVFALLWSGVWVSGTINRKGHNMTTIDFLARWVRALPA